MDPKDFAARLNLAIKVVSVSRGQLASELRVDKSVFSRWCGGGALPSSNNLARLTSAIASRREGFSMLDWERPLAEFSARLGVVEFQDLHPAAPEPHSPSLAVAELMAPEMLREAIGSTRARFESYEGFWRTTRPSNTPLGGFMHDHVMMWRDASGLLRTRMGVYEMRFDGWVMQIHAQLFGIATDPVAGLFLFSIFNGVFRQQALTLDGITLTCQSNAGGTPVAAACLMERIGNLGGDFAADERRLGELAQLNPFAPAETIPSRIRHHLWRDVGPTAFAAGGDPLLMMAYAKSLSGAGVPPESPVAFDPEPIAFGARRKHAAND